MSPSDPSDDRWFRRVQALLAKAESTTYPPEAEALLAKAQALMTAHAIDNAMLAAAGSRQRPAVVSESVLVLPPYASAATTLLGAVAAANRCRCVEVAANGSARRCVLVGIDDDVRASTTLFAALRPHAARALLTTAVAPHETPRRFRHAFLLAFAHRVGQRLRDVAADAAAVAGASPGTRSLAVVLADRDHEVSRAFVAQFPHTRPVRRQASSAAGVREGHAAGDRAPLGTTMLDGPRPLGAEAGR